MLTVKVTSSSATQDQNDKSPYRMKTFLLINCRQYTKSPNLLMLVMRISLFTKTLSPYEQFCVLLLPVKH